MGVKDFESKTKAKDAMHALQDLGERIAQVPLSKLKELELPERLYDAFEVLTRTRGHEGTRRQKQFIGKLMRQVDPEPIEAKLAMWDRSSVEAKAIFKQCERWRDRLLTEADALDTFVAAFPHAERIKLARLITEAKNEAAQKQPPKHARLLFRAVQTILNESLNPSPVSSDNEAST